ncbi:MAG: RNA polymerase sigma factor [Acidimicrobiia bacterium]|nr:RNA polymerase sigma factor [Acidimicrobiia bacterium]
MDSRSDAEIISASLDDVSEFGVIYRRHFKAVFAFVARRVDRSEAADLTSDIFVKALDVRHRFDTSQPTALPWLYRIGRNVIGDRMRRVSRRSRLDVVIRGGSEWELVGESAETAALLSVSVSEMEEALKELPRRQREVLLLSSVDGCSHAEIAQILGISKGVVATRLFRARERLAEIAPVLRQQPPKSPDPPTEEDRG